MLADPQNIYGRAYGRNGSRIHEEGGDQKISPIFSAMSQSLTSPVIRKRAHTRIGVFTRIPRPIPIQLNAAELPCIAEPAGISEP